MLRKKTKQDRESVFSGPTPPGHVAKPEGLVLCAVILHWRKLIFPLPVSILCNFLIRNGLCAQIFNSGIFVCLFENVCVIRAITVSVITPR